MSRLLSSLLLIAALSIASTKADGANETKVSVNLIHLLALFSIRKIMPWIISRCLHIQRKADVCFRFWSTRNNYSFDCAHAPRSINAAPALTPMRAYTNAWIHATISLRYTQHSTPTEKDCSRAANLNSEMFLKHSVFHSESDWAVEIGLSFTNFLYFE